MAKAYDFSLKTIDGQDQSLGDNEGKVMLIVNVASKCGFTPQYTGLVNLYRKFQDDGLRVLGVPCNQFGRQEPGTEAEIKEFCGITYGVNFDMYSKVDVNGENSHPLYAWLTGPESPEPGPIKWNFEKFLINRKGEIVARFGSSDKPEGDKISSAVQKEISA